MTLRLDGLVVRGEIDNTRPYSVCGWLKLRGYRTPLTLNLTGDGGPTIQGRRIRFEHPIPPDDRPEVEESEELAALAWQQIGPTGPMTMMVGDAQQRNRLTLEWFSQNGHVSLEIENPLCEMVSDEDELETEADDEAQADLAAFCQDESEVDEDDPYGLFTPELMQHFDDEADRLDRQALAEDEPTSVGDSGSNFADFASVPGFSEAEYMEDLIANVEGVPIGVVFDPPIQLPRPAGLSDAEAEAALKRLLARMAEHGISLDVCEHFKPPDAYRLLLDEICPFELTHPDLEATQWVQHFSTSDFCEACEAEFEREFEEFERNRRREEDDED